MKVDGLTGGSQVVVGGARAASVCRDVRDVENTRAHVHVLSVASPVEEQRVSVCFTGQTDICSLDHD